MSCLTGATAYRGVDAIAATGDDIGARVTSWSGERVATEAADASGVDSSW